MTSTDLTVPGSLDLAAQMSYARAVSTAALLPAAYRGKPADILIATGLGNAIGIPPAQALYEIYVVNGRPSPSANLMAALVRRAGHKLRVRGDARSATATLIRADDPEYPFEATWTIEQAQAAHLTGKDTWKQYPQAMLRARAISEVVRMGAPEAVLGMEYSREEMVDVAPAAPTPARVTAADFTAPATPTEPAETPGDVTDAPEAITDAQSRKMGALMREAGLTDRAEALAYVGATIGREIQSRSELTKAEASTVIDALERAATEVPTDDLGSAYDTDELWPTTATPGGES